MSLLGHRAETASLTGVSELADLVPLLFAHTTYKSYPESWLVQKKWDRMANWLGTVSTYSVARVDDAGIEDIDDWLARLESSGNFVSCSSGTTGKCSMLAASVDDRLFSKRQTSLAFAWGTSIPPEQDFKVMAVVPGPGLQLISFDPKASISMIGAEALESEETMDKVAELAASDITIFNQEACIASRYVFAEGPRERIDRFCEKLLARLGVDREFASALSPPLPADLREEVDVLRMMGGDYRVWGRHDGAGLVIRSPEPVDFHPTNKAANVVEVASLADAVRYVNVATQTVGIYPARRKEELRNALATAGAQRIVRLGSASRNTMGAPHDAMYPLARFVHWTVDEDI